MEDFLPNLPEQTVGLPPVNELHALSLANHLVTLYTTKSITDISVKCGDETFDLHSPVLSHGSGYFRRVFADDQAEITLEFTPSIESSTFQIIVDSLYTGIVSGMTEGNVTSILEASFHMEIKHAFHACVEFMLKHMDLENCLEYWLSARVCRNSKVQDSSIELIGRHLDDVSRSPDFLNLQSNTVIDIFSDDKLQVASEVQVYEAAMAWIKDDPESREQELSYILDAIRLPLLPKAYLINTVGKEVMIEENPEAVKKYSKALASQLGGESKRIKGRHNALNGMRGGYEKVSKSFRVSMMAKPKISSPVGSIPVGGYFANCCTSEDEDSMPQHGMFEDTRSSIVLGAQNIGTGVQHGAQKLGASAQEAMSCLGSSSKSFRESMMAKSKISSPVRSIPVGGYFANCCTSEDEDGMPQHGMFEDTRSSIVLGAQNIGTGVQHGAQKLGASAQEAMSGLGSSLKILRKSITNPETFNNLGKRHVGGYWLDVNEEEIRDENCAQDQEENDGSLQFDDSSNTLQRSFSVGEPLDEVPEVNEEDLSDGRSFDMDGLSEEFPEILKSGDDDDEQAVNEESRVVGEDLLDLLDDDSQTKGDLIDPFDHKDLTSPQKENGEINDNNAVKASDEERDENGNIFFDV